VPAVLVAQQHGMVLVRPVRLQPVVAGRDHADVALALGHGFEIVAGGQHRKSAPVVDAA
jgi:hypothetical protein